jgi:hypothetical protein
MGNYRRKDDRRGVYRGGDKYVSDSFECNFMCGSKSRLSFQDTVHLLDISRSADDLFVPWNGGWNLLKDAATLVCIPNGNG